MWNASAIFSHPTVLASIDYTSRLAAATCHPWISSIPTTRPKPVASSYYRFSSGVGPRQRTSQYHDLRYLASSLQRNSRCLLSRVISQANSQQPRNQWLSDAYLTHPLTAQFSRSHTSPASCISDRLYSQNQPFHNMAEKLSLSSDEDSLSPVAEDLIAEMGVNEKGKSARAHKRKAVTSASTGTKRPRKVGAVNGDVKAPADATAQSRPTKRRVRDKMEPEEEDVGEAQDVEKLNIALIKKKPTPRRNKGANLAPLHERTKETHLRVGAHVSSAGGVHNTITNLIHIGANSFALFLKSQRKWDNPELDPEVAKLFIEGCKQHGIDVGECCLPHGSYLVNLAHPDPDRKKQAYDSFANDLARCHTLGIKLYNFHPGNANATTHEDGIRLIAENINQAHRDPNTGDVITVLETMATLGNTIGGTFADLANIITLVDNKDRVGVCLDTCHVFAAGYDLRSPETYATTMGDFDTVIGLKYLKALHMNDSKAPLSSNRDLHAQIGTGYLGLRAFHNIVNDKRLHGLPMVLETPTDVVGKDGKKSEDKTVWAREIKLLESLVGMDVESQEFLDLESKLHDEGKDEREKIGGQVERKMTKDAKAKAKETRKKNGLDTARGDIKMKGKRSVGKVELELEHE